MNYFNSANYFFVVYYSDKSNELHQYSAFICHFQGIHKTEETVKELKQNIVGTEYSRNRTQ